MSLFPITKIKNATITSYVESQVTEAQNFKQIVRGSKGHRWEFKIDTVQLTGAEPRETFAFLASLDGKAGVFELYLPEHSEPYNSQFADCILDGAVSAGQNTVQLAGLKVDTPKLITGGDFIRFNKSSKIYMVNTTTGSSGASATIQVTPALRDDLLNGSPVQVTNINWSVSLSKDPVKIERKSRDYNSVSYSIEAMEAIR